MTRRGTGFTPPAPARRLRLAVALCLVALLATSALAREPRFKRGDRRRVQTDYREALAALGAGDADGALERLLRLEGEALGFTERARVEPLVDAEREVLLELAEDRAEALVPVVLLHHRAYVAHVERGAPTLAAGARILAAEIADWYAARGSSGPLAAGLYASLGAHLQQAFQGRRAARLFQRALEIDAGSSTALLGLAAEHEKRGDYDDALELLEILVEVHPGNPEGRLRLAVNLERAGRTAEATRALRRVVDLPAPHWVHSLAYQELARSLTRDGEIETAYSLLLQGMQRLPCDPTLPIQAAYVGDRVGEADLDLEATLRRCAGGVGAPPRSLYNRTPQTAVDLLRADLAGAAAERLPQLSEALAESS